MSFIVMSSLSVPFGKLLVWRRVDTIMNMVYEFNWLLNYYSVKHLKSILRAFSILLLVKLLAILLTILVMISVVLSSWW
jgi:hypothetical protein